MRILATIAIIVIAFQTQTAPQQRASQQQQLRANAPGGGLAPDVTLPHWPTGHFYEHQSPALARVRR